MEHLLVASVLTFPLGSPVPNVEALALANSQPKANGGNFANDYNPARSGRIGGQSLSLPSPNLSLSFSP